MLFFYSFLEDAMAKTYILGLLLFFCSLEVISFVGERKSFMQIEPKKMVAVRSLEQLADIVKKAAASGYKLSLAGTRKSQGGQTVDVRSTTLVMSNLNKVISFDKKNKRIAVQAGMTWKELLPILNEAGLSIKTMQSYCDFGIGGSLGVNCHGQDIHNTCLSESVESIKIMVADGSIMEASAEKNAELFRLAIGGYGLFGIITEVTLRLTDNMILQKKAEVIKTSDYPNYFETTVKHNKNVALHSARLTVAPNELLTQALIITYTSTGQKAPLDLFSIPAASKINQAALENFANMTGCVVLDYLLKRTSLKKMRKFHAIKLLHRPSTAYKILKKARMIFYKSTLFPALIFLHLLNFSKSM